MMYNVCMYWCDISTEHPKIKIFKKHFIGRQYEGLSRKQALDIFDKKLNDEMIWSNPEYSGDSAYGYKVNYGKSEKIVRIEKIAQI